MGLLPFFPLASGLLTGKYKRDVPPPKGTRLATTQRLADRYLTERNWRKVEGLEDFAKRAAAALLELAFSWLAAKPACRASSPARRSRSSSSRTSRRSSGR